jgi:glycosyltransferase involved in cell wall biosynthesis
MNGTALETSKVLFTHESPTRRLWMVNQYAISPDMPGGSRHFELARALGAYNWETSIIATPFSHKTAEFLRPVSFRHPFANENAEGVTFRWLYSLPYSQNDWRRYANMLTFGLGLYPASLGLGEPDAVLGSSPHLLAALGAWAVAKRFSVPFLFEVRDLWPETLVQMGLRNPAIIGALSRIERFLYRQADLIPYLTEGIGEGIASKGVEREKLLFLPNASSRPLPLDAFERLRIRCQLGWEDDIVAIYAGAHGPANALEEVVAAARQLPESSRVRIVFVGDGPSKDALRVQAEGLDRVTFMDSIPKSEIAAVLRAADIGLLSLRQTKVFEGARPNKLFDYLASGLPIISTIGGEVAHVLAEAKAGTFSPPEKLASTLLEWSRNPDQRRAMGRSGFEYVSNTLTREDTAQTLAAHLDRLSARRQQAKG